MTRYQRVPGRSLTQHDGVDLQSILAGDPLGVVPEKVVVLAIVGQGSHDSEIFDYFFTSVEELELVTVKGFRQRTRTGERK